jgi:ribosome-associated protein
MDDHLNDSEIEVAAESELGERKRRARRHEAQDDEVPTGAVARREPRRQETALELARVCARIAEDNRGRDIVLLDLRGASPLFDFFVLATAPSRRQAATIISDVDAQMKRRGEHKIGAEGEEDGRWALIDYGDFVVHVFADDARSFYALEDIWGDAPRLEWQDPKAPQRFPQIHQPDEPLA